jgi:hypothetical protein
MQQQCDKTRPGDDDERMSVDDADRYLRLVVAKADGRAIIELQQKFEQDDLRLRCIVGADIGRQDDVPSRSWCTDQLCVSRDYNSNEKYGPIDFATGKVTARNDGHAFVEQLVASDPSNAYELTVSARDVRILWPPPQADQAEQKSEPTEQEEEAEATPLVTAIKARIAAGHHPGKSEQWERFCDKVRDDAGVKKSDRGCGDRSIRRIVENLPNK